ncbi:hypothetical protein ACWD4N_00415 [Streptomyces sp. NPDC002586]
MRPTLVSSVRSSLSVSSLEEVESAFLALAAAPWPLSLPGSLLTESAADALPVTVVRARLVHPSCTASGGGPRDGDLWRWMYGIPGVRRHS